MSESAGNSLSPHPPTCATDLVGEASIRLPTARRIVRFQEHADLQLSVCTPCVASSHVYKQVAATLVEGEGAREHHSRLHLAVWGRWCAIPILWGCKGGKSIPAKDCECGDLRSGEVDVFIFV